MFYKKFVKVPIKILDEVAPIFVNSRLIAMGHYGTILGKRIKVVTSTAEQLRFFLSVQSSSDKTPEYHGAVIDDVYFLYTVNNKNSKVNNGYNPNGVTYGGRDVQPTVNVSTMFLTHVSKEW